MNGKIFFIVMVIALGIISCSKESTTAPEEQKYYLFQATGSDPVPPGGGNPKVREIAMTKNAGGIWQATVIVPAVGLSTTTAANSYYTVLFSNARVIYNGSEVYGDTARPPASAGEISIRTRIIPFPVINATINKGPVYGNIPRLNPIRVGNVAGPISRPDTLVFSLDPVNMTFSVQ